jgi:hypothetical protein
MQNTHSVDVYKVHLLATSLVNNRISPDEFQRECHRLTEIERRALYERLEQLQGQRRSGLRD